MKNPVLTLGFFALIVASSCSSGDGGTIFTDSKLPENPTKLIFEWNEGGGMLPEGQDIYLSVDSSYWNMWRLDYDQRIYFQTSQAELDSIYQIFIDNEFDNIQLIEEQEVYDRGGTSVRTIVDGEYFDKNNSGMTFIAENWWPEYDACENAVYQFAMKKIESSKTAVTIQLSKELANSAKYKYYLTVNDALLFDSEKDSGITIIDTLLYKTVNGFSLSMYNKDSLDYYGNPSFISSHNFRKAISDTSNTILFSLDKNGNPLAQ